MMILPEKIRLKLDNLVESRNSIEFVIPAEAGIQGPGENRNPVFEMVPDFRRNDVWTPAFAGVTLQDNSYEIIKIESIKSVKVEI
jgi:hypothetical protein